MQNTNNKKIYRVIVRKGGGEEQTLNGTWEQLKVAIFKAAGDDKNAMWALCYPRYTTAFRFVL